MTARIDEVGQAIKLDAIKQIPIARIARWLGLYVSKDEKLARCLRPERHKNGDAHPSLSFFNANGCWLMKCHACGFGGNAIELAKMAKGWDFGEAVREISLHFLGAENKHERRSSRSSTKGDRDGWWQKIWAEGRDTPKDLSIIRTYLKSRGLSGTVPTDSRLHPAQEYRDDKGNVVGKYPCWLMPVRDKGGEMIGLQRVWLSPDGHGKAPVSNPKKSAGKIAGGGIQLFPVEVDTLGLAEGPETAIAVHEAKGLPVWSCVSASGMRSFEPPDWVKHLAIFADSGPAGIEAADVLAARAHEKGVEVRIVIPPKKNDGEPFSDFLDAMNALGPESVSGAYEEAESWTPKPETDEESYRRLAALPLADYDRVRIDEARKLGIRVETLDKEVRRVREESEEPETNKKTRRGQEVIPCEEPVDGNKLLSELVFLFETYVVLPPGASTALCLWTLYTYLFELWPISPYIYITAPEKRSGKTTCLTLLMYLCQRAKTVSNTTTAPVYREAGQKGLTVGFDEVDMYVKGNPELLGILNAGHQREGAWVERWNSDKGKLEEFFVFHPKAFSGIGHLKDTLEDRSVILTLRRKRKEEMVKKLSLLDGSRPFLPLARKCARWALDNMEAAKRAKPSYPEELSDREEDNWHPLLCIAEAVGGEWLDKARQAAVLLSTKREMDAESVGVQLLGAIRDIFEEKGIDAIFSEDLANSLAQLEGSPWEEYGRSGKPISKNQVSRIIRRYGIRPKQVRIKSETKKGYNREWFDGAFSCYLPQSPIQSETTKHSLICNENSEIQSETQGEDVSVENPEFPFTSNDCFGVSVRQGGQEEESKEEQPEREKFTV